MIRFNIEDSTTATKFAQTRLPGLTDEKLKKLFKIKAMHKNGEPLKKDAPLAPGDILELFTEGVFDEYTPAPVTVYEDENIIIYNKPCGMACDYPHEKREVTVLTFAEEHMRKTGEYNRDILAVPYLCTPLDRYTGGLVLIAKDENVFLTVSEALKQRRIRRFFTLLVCGNTLKASGELHHHIITNSKKDTVKIQNSPGNMSLPVVTRYRVKTSNHILTVIEAEPVTDRLHQIRAQFQFADMPILGDEEFGNRKNNAKYGIHHECLNETRFEFCVGQHSILSYLDGKKFEIGYDALPYFPGLIYE